MEIWSVLILTQKDREFYGIYTHSELIKAVSLGYKITEVFEIYTRVKKIAHYDKKSSL